MIKNYYLVFLIGLFLYSCNGNDVYMQYIHINDGKWDKDSICNFEFEITDTVSRYNLYVNVRNLSEYPYQNLWLFIQKTQSDSIVANDTIEFYLADKKGKWLGRGVGAAYEMPVLYQQNIKFNNSGKYHYSIVQGMRDTVLNGINDVGIRLEKQVTE